MRLVVVILSIFFSETIAANTPAWSVQPHICISQQLGEACQLTFNIETENMPNKPLCLFIDGQLLQCAQAAKFTEAITVTIQQDALLELKNSAQHTLVSHPLQLKFFATKTRRKRVRPPWSLF